MDNNYQVVEGTEEFTHRVCRCDFMFNGDKYEADLREVFDNNIPELMIFKYKDNRLDVSNPKYVEYFREVSTLNFFDGIDHFINKMMDKSTSTCL